MYEFRPVTKRIKELREQIRERVLRYEAQRAVIMTEADKKYEHIVPLIKRPLCVKELCERIELYIGDTEIIVGSKGAHQFGCAAYPEWIPDDWLLEFVGAGLWKIEEDGLYHNPDGEELKQTIHPDDYEAMLKIRPYWDDHRVGTVADAWKPEFYDELARLGISSYVDGGMGLASLPAGHIVAGYEKVIHTGYAAIRGEAQDFLDAHRGKIMGADVEKYMFYQSIVIVCDAAITLVKRYAQACRGKADQCQEQGRRDELLKMADGLDYLSENPARNFWEAVQLTMMYQVLIQIESLIPGPALGRFDQYTWPFLKKDLQEGKLLLWRRARKAC